MFRKGPTETLDYNKMIALFKHWLLINALSVALHCDASVDSLS